MKIFVSAFLSFFLIFSSCKLNEKQHRTGYASVHDTTQWDGMYYDMNNMWPGDSLYFSFDTITQKDFEQYKKNYHSKLKQDSTRITVIDTCLIIKTQDSSYTFCSPKNKIVNGYEQFTDASYYYYNGYISSLGLYSITVIDLHNEIGQTFLIDSKTNKKYALFAPFDDECEPPLVSPKNKYMLSISNNVYEDNQGFITLIGIEKNKGVFSYKGLIAYTSNEWKIRELVWINEKTFALHIVISTRNEQTNEITQTENYLKGSFGPNAPVTESTTEE
jgi:hypothetical protein